jgi:predicted DNA-binding transcriptional regulator AlpA
MELSTTATADARRARRKPEYVPDDPLLTAAEAAAERGQALSTFWRDVRAGRVPPAYRVSPRCPRWRRSELRTALEACRAPVKVAVRCTTNPRG